MKSKLIVNIKKLISILICTAMISSTLPTNLLSYVVFADNESIPVSTFEELRTALNNSNNGDIIVFNDDITIPDDATLDNNVCLVCSGEKTITINGNNHTLTNAKTSNIQILYLLNGPTVNLNNIAIDCGGPSSTFNQYNAIEVSGSSTLNMSETTLKNFKSTTDKHLIFTGYQTTVSLNNSSITECETTSGNGVIYIDSSSTLQANDSSISNCTAANGGAVYLSGNSTFTQNGGSISDCSANGNGGAVYVGGASTLTFKGTISGCTAKNGGAIYSDWAHVIQDGGTILNCSANENGGAMAISNVSTLQAKGIIENCQSNTPQQNGSGGGAIYLTSSQLSANQLTINNCEALSGGAIYLGASQMELSNSQIINCKSTTTTDYKKGGGGIFIDGAGTSTINNSTIFGCHANQDGGAICATGSGQTYLTNTAITNCNADGNGGGICNNPSSKLTIYSGEISGCSTGVQGNAIYNDWGTELLFTNSNANLISITVPDSADGNKDNCFDIFGYPGIYDVYPHDQSRIAALFTVTLDANGGVIGDEVTPATFEPIILKSGQTLGNLLPTNLTKNGIPLSGWVDANNNSITSTTPITSDVNLTAQYTPLTPQITLTSLTKVDDTQYTAGDWSNKNINLIYSISSPTSTINPDKYKISIDGGTTFTDIVSSNLLQINQLNTSNLSFTILQDGEYNIVVEAYDAENRSGQSEAVSVKVDKIKPDSVEITSPEYSNSSTPTIYGTGEIGCQITVTDENDNVIGTAIVDENGEWEISKPISEGEHTISVIQTDKAGNTSDSQSQTLIVDITLPTGTITIKNNDFNTFLNTITFGLLFNDTTNITITTEDTPSGIKELKYLKTDRVYSSIANIPADANWQNTGLSNGNSISFNVDVPQQEFNDKFFIYAKITDNADNVTYIRSDGVILYKDSAITTDEITYTKPKEENEELSVILNGNTIASVVNTTNNYTLRKDVDYTISDSKVILKYEYLNTLAENRYDLEISFNPAGETNIAESVTLPKDTVIMYVEKSTQELPADDAKFSNLQSSYTYGDNPGTISLNGGSGTGAVTYSSDHEDVAIINSTTGELTIVGAGTFEITANKASDENYKHLEVKSGVITVNKRPVTISGIIANSKTYDGNNNATFDITNAKIENLVNNDQITISFGNASFADQNAGDNKEVYFSSFSILDSSSNTPKNYILQSQPANGSANITPKPVTINNVTADNKEYDGNNSATVNMHNVSINGKLTGDNLEITKGSATFDNKNVGTGKTVTFTEFGLSGTDKNNYILSAQPTNVTANISPKTATINLSIKDKEYDGTTNAEYNNGFPNIEGLIAEDDVELNIDGEPTFSNKNAGENKWIILPNFSLKGNDKDNYTLSTQPINLTASIAPKPLIVTNIAIDNKEYDGSDIATFSESNISIEGKIDNEDVSVDIESATFEDKNVGVGKTVTFSEFSLIGHDKNNYTLLTHPENTTANIDPKPVTIIGVTANSKSYDGDTRANINIEYASINGKLDNDDLSIVQGSATFDNKNAETGKTVTFTNFGLGGNDAGNYTLSSQPANVTADITPKSVTIVGVTANSKLYDRDIHANINIEYASINGKLDNDDLSIVQGSAIFDNKNAGTEKTVTFSGFSLSGSDAGNYALLSQPTNVTADITPKPVTIIGVTANSKPYDRNTHANINIEHTSINGKLDNDDLSIVQGSANFDNKNAGTGKTVTFTEFELSGNDASNYNLLSQPTNVTADIFSKHLTISNVKIKNKPYDNTNTAEFDGNPTLNNVINGDDVQLINGVPIFSSKDVGQNIPISFSPPFSLDGNDASNYDITQPDDITAEIYTPTSSQINDPTLIKDNNQPYTPGSWSNKNVTASYTIESGSFPIDTTRTQISLNGIDFIDLANVDSSQIQINQSDNSNVSFTILQDGEYQVQIKVFDEQGNANTSNTVSIKIDKTKPASVTIASSEYSNSSTPTISGTGEPGCIIIVTDENNQEIGTTTVDEDGNWQISNPISEGEHTISVVQVDSAGNTSEPVSKTFIVDTTPPSGVISIRNNDFNTFLNTVTFGLLFKETTNIVIASSDTYTGETGSASIILDGEEPSAPIQNEPPTPSGIKEIKYLKTDQIYSNITDLPADANWQTSALQEERYISFNVDIPQQEFNEKFFVYAKITDKANNVTYLRSDGVILYTDSEITSNEITHFKPEEINKELSVTLNGNTIASIINTTNSEALQANVDYTVEGSKITLKHEYLNKLDENNYNLEISFSPAGETNLAEYITLPKDEVALYIKKSDQQLSPDDAKFNNLNSSYTYGDNPGTISLNGGSGTGAVTYMSTNTNVATINSTTGELTIVGAGTFEITAFKSGDDNYKPLQVTSDTITVNKRPVTISGIVANSKPYDGNNDASFDRNNAKIENLVNNDQITIRFGSASFADQNVGNDKEVYFSDFSILDSSNNIPKNYVLESQPANGSANITPKLVTIVDVAANSKPYDGDTHADINIEYASINGKLDNDDLSIVQGSATFDNKNAGTGKTVTFTNFGLSGNDAGNYALSSQPANVTANISPKTISINFSIKDKVYDGTINAEFNDQVPQRPEGIVDSDSAVVLCYYGPSFYDKNVGNDKPIYFEGFSLQGPDKSNYTLSQPTNLTANISAKPLTITGITVDDKVYDGNTKATFSKSNMSIEGKIDNEDVSVNIESVIFDDKNVGVGKTVSFSGFSLTGYDKNNYTLSTHPENTTANITPKPVTINNVIADNKEYDGNNSATVNMHNASINGKLDNDDLSIVQGSATFDNKNAGTGKTVTFTEFELSGNDAGNYALSSQPANVTANISPKTISINFSIKDKVYDGTKTAQFDGQFPPPIEGFIEGDKISITNIYVPEFDNKNVGEDKLIFFPGFNLEGEDKDNYILSQPENLTANITPKPVTINNITANSKSYDGDTHANINIEHASINGKLDNDDLSIVQGSATFDNKNAGTGKTVTFSGFSLTGNNAGNYVLSSQPENTTANITPLSVTITNVAADNKVYDGTIKAIPNISNASIQNTIDGDNVFISAGSATFANKNVGNNKTVTFSEFTLGGDDANNYLLSAQPENATANISRKPLYISNIKIKDKIPDGTRTAEFEGTPTLEGLADGDNVILINGIPIFTSSAEGQNISIDFSPPFSLEGEDSSNYDVIQPANIYGNIVFPYNDSIPSKPDDSTQSGDNSSADDSTQPSDDSSANDSTQPNSDTSTQSDVSNTNTDDTEEAFEAEDSVTGIQVSAPKGVFPKWCRLVVIEMQPNTNEYDDNYENLDDDKKSKIEHAKLYEIHIINQDGQIVQPDISKGLITVNIPIPSDYDLADIEIYRIKEDADDDFDEIIVDIDNKTYCQFETNHFSPYTMIDENTLNDIIQTILPYLILLLILIFLILFIILLIKRKKDEEEEQQ